MAEKINVNWSIASQWEDAFAECLRMHTADKKYYEEQLGLCHCGDEKEEEKDLCELTCKKCGAVTIMDPEYGYADFRCPQCGAWLDFDFEKHYGLDPEDNFDLWYKDSVKLGDELEAHNGRYAQHGVVVGIINDCFGRPVCYKVWRSEDPDDWRTGCFDYIQAGHVTMHEMWGHSDTALLRIGYELIELNDGLRVWRNEETGDDIIW